MARRHHSLLPLVLISTLLLTACSDSSEPEEGAAATTEAPEATAPPTTSPPATLAETTVAEDESSDAQTADGEELFPDVLDATASQSDDGSLTVNATLSSPYDSPERYADAWRVVGPDGTEYGVRVLTHDHASEQPFTRSHSGIEIPDGVTTVTIQGRDQVSGWGGDTFELVLAS